MPEDSGKEPTEKEQQERYDECVDGKKKRTRRLRFRAPQELANFLVSHKPSYAYMSATRIKQLFPDIGSSVKKLNELMQHPDFYKAVNEQIPDVNKQQANGMFDMVLQQYFEGQMQLKRGDVLCPDAKAIAIFGQYSGRFDPTQKYEISGGMSLTEEKKKEVIEETLRAWVNRQKRLAAMKEEGGGNNGNN